MAENRLVLALFERKRLGMGRRSLSTMGPKEAREVIGSHFRRLTSSTGVNMAVFRAQLHEEEMVKVIAGIALDPLQLPSIRISAASKVLEIARGAIRPWVHDGQTVDPRAEGITGATVGEEIQAARMTAELYEEINALTMKRVPPEQWPESVRLAAGNLLATYSEKPD